MKERLDAFVERGIPAQFETLCSKDELEKVNVKRPRNVLSIDRVAGVDTIRLAILPWLVSNSDILRLQSDEVIIECRNENEQQLVGLLK